MGAQYSDERDGTALRATANAVPAEKAADAIRRTTIAFASQLATDRDAVIVHGVY